jgi:signal transduction histidine kinase
MPVVFGLDKRAPPLSEDALAAMVEPDYRQRWREAFQSAEKGGHVSLECDVRHASGQVRRVNLHIDPELGPDGRVARLHGICHDVTEQILLERKYLQAQKMEAVGRLTGGIAHDFNNLLTVVLGNLQLAEQLAASDEPLAKRLKAAIAAVSKGADLTKRLLAFSREQTLGSDILDLKTHLPGMHDMLSRATGEGIKLKIVADAPVWPVAADRTQLETAILNLAINARDAMAEGGTVVVETSNASLDEAYCRTHADVTAGEYVVIAVTDTGYGIPKDIIDKVVQPFFTTKAPGEGSGLGLSMVYGFVKQSGGDLNIYSEEGVGTTVKMYLPRHHAETSAVETEASPAKAPEEADIAAAIAEVKLESEPETSVAAMAEAPSATEPAPAVAAEDSAPAAVEPTEAPIVASDATAARACPSRQAGRPRG